MVAGFGKSCDFGHSSVQIKATEPKRVNARVTLFILIREKREELATLDPTLDRSRKTGHR